MESKTILQRTHDRGEWSPSDILWGRCPECNQDLCTLVERISQEISNPDNYEDGEPKPSSETIDKIFKILHEARDLPSTITRPQISTFYGELDVTWETEARMIRLAAMPGSKPAQLYKWIKTDAPIPEGEIRDATAQDLVEEIRTLYSKTT